MSEVIQGNNSVSIIDDKDTINKTVNIDKTTKVDLATIEQELTLMRKAQENHNKLIRKVVKMLTQASK